LQICQQAIYNLLFEDGVAAYANAVAFAMFWPEGNLQQRTNMGRPSMPIPIVAVASQRASLVLELVPLGRELKEDPKLSDLDAGMAGLEVLQELFKDASVNRVAWDGDLWQQAEQRLADLPERPAWGYCQNLSVRIRFLPAAHIIASHVHSISCAHGDSPRAHSEFSV
jgi:hypothetical protein